MDLDEAYETNALILNPYHVAPLVPPQYNVPDEVPFSERALNERSGSHVLLPVFPFAIRELLDDAFGQPYPFAERLHYRGAWWYDEPSLRELARQPLEGRWMLVNRDPVRFSKVSVNQCIHDEPPLPYERRLNARETLYALMACELMPSLACEGTYPLRLPDRGYAALAFDDHAGPHPFTIWNTGYGYLLNTLGPGRPLDMPYFALTEYVEVGDLYEKPGC